MRRARWLAVTVLLPLLYAAAVLVSTRHPKPVYALPEPTVMTVTENPGPAILHAPDAIYPPQALRDRVEGSVKFKVAIVADGTVANARLVSGPAPLAAAALAALRQYQFEAKPAETDIDVGFSLSNATRSLSPPEPIERKKARLEGLHGVVRVVATINAEGRVDFVQPVSGPDFLLLPAMDAVKQWKFRPALRNGQPAHGTVVLDVPF